jgi:VanZ family protein
VVVLLSLYVLFAPSPGGTVSFPGADKLVHAGLFGLLAATTRWRFGPAAHLLVGVAAYAALSEVVQATALRQRSGDLLDVAADLAGAAVGWWLARRRLARD